jgi:hypothetical protein
MNDAVSVLYDLYNLIKVTNIFCLTTHNSYGKYLSFFARAFSFPKRVNYEGIFKPENLNADLLFALYNINSTCTLQC